MPIILVVDDSETDRTLVGGLLRPKLDWIVQYAENGAQGIEMIGQIFPDVVVTDLQMPEMDGIQLCLQAKAEYPHVPIILITGKGSEELAVEALEAGAASYVPKSALSSSLLDTVEQVLSLAKHDKSQGRLLKFATNTRHQFNLECDQTLIGPMTDFVQIAMENLRLGDQAEQRHCVVAIEEALINAIFHGNLELDGLSVQEARRAMHDGEISDSVTEKLQDPRFKDRRVRLGIEFNRKEINIVVRDDGPGFDSAAKIVNADDLSQLSGAGGRGLTLIRKFMSEMHFNDDGNELRMSLKLKSQAKSPVAAEA